MSAFHRWLLKHRPYCELCTGAYPSTRIIDIQGHNKAVCDAHFQSHHPLRAGFEKRQQRETWDEIVTRYNNEANPSGFLKLGKEQTQPNKTQI